MGRQLNPTTWSIVALILAILALQAANGTAAGVSLADPSLPILSLAFIALTMTLAAVSVGGRMRLSLQLLAIYFSIYLLLPGYNHASTNRFPFYNFSYPAEIRTDAAMIVAGFLVAVLSSYALTMSRSGRRPAREQQAGYEVSANAGLGIALTLVSVVSFVVFIRTLGLTEALSLRSSDASNGLDIVTTGLSVSLPRILTFLPVIYATLIVAHGRPKALGWVLLAANLPILLITNFPLAIARSQLFGAVLLFAMLLVNFRSPIKRGMLSFAFVFGALVAMPVLDHFTRQGRTWAELDPQQMITIYFNTGDFDGFQSVNNAVVYVDRFGYEYGLQILSAALFFIPRAVWAGKAQPTGTITAEAAGYSFTNISQPLPSEFFVDFGWTGVLVGGILLGFLLAKLDRWWDRGWMNDMRARLAAGWVMGFGLTIYRGSLLAVSAPFIILAFGLLAISALGLRRTAALPA